MGLVGEMMKRKVSEEPRLERGWKWKGGRDAAVSQGVCVAAAEGKEEGIEGERSELDPALPPVDEALAAAASTLAGIAFPAPSPLPVEELS